MLLSAQQCMLRESTDEQTGAIGETAANQLDLALLCQVVSNSFFKIKPMIQGLAYPDVS